MHILVTGGSGFIGSHFIRHILASDASCRVTNLDLLTYAGNPRNLEDVEAAYARRYAFVQGDICDSVLVRQLAREVQAVVHFAAESHVDRSIEDAQAFIRTNVLGTSILLEAARLIWPAKSEARFIYISTDEVYGSLELGDGRSFREDWPLRPRSPYSASKAAGDHLALAYHHTYGLPVMVTRCSNNYGPYQFPEKLIPLMLLNALAHKELPVYGDGLYVRDWLYVEDHCRAVALVLRNGQTGQVYNIGGGQEESNINLLKELLTLLARRLQVDPAQYYSLIRHVADRPGHDRRYAIDAGKIKSELGFQAQYSLTQGLNKTIDWYLQNQDWCREITSGQYQEYYKRMYHGR